MLQKIIETWFRCSCSYLFKNFIRCNLFLLILFLCSQPSKSQQLAFPGAEGFGSMAKGGRNGKVIKVTNLKDSGSGSLREAIASEGPRTIIFEIGGLITLDSSLVINNPNVTIAGQTAPGDGIAIRGGGFVIKASEVIIRYLRIRPGDKSFTEGVKKSWSNLDGVTMHAPSKGQISNIIIDNCSISWAIDEVVGIWGNVRNVTIQNSIISEGLYDSKHFKGVHSMGMLIGADSRKISILRNLFAHNNSRHPYVNGIASVDFRNNVIYNAGYFITRLNNYEEERQLINYVGNHIIPGENTSASHEILINNLKWYRGQIFIKNNIAPSSSNTNSNLAMIGDKAQETELNDVKIISDHSFKTVNTTTLESKQVLSHVLENSGAIIPFRDPVDKRIIHEVKNRSGKIINSQNQVGGWPKYSSGIPLLDSDGDGMPDSWEKKNGLEVNSSEYAREDTIDIDNDGYTNIEEFLNFTDPKNIDEKSSTYGSSVIQGYDTNTEEQTKINLSPNYPNPFNNQTRIEFTLNHPSSVRVNVYNINGQLVERMVNSFLYTGKYQLIWDGKGKSSGIYFVTFLAGQQKMIQKMTLVK